MSNQDDVYDASIALKAVRSMCLVCAVCSVMSNIGWYLKFGVGFTQWYVAAAVSLVGTAFAWLYRDMRRWLGITIFFTVIGFNLLANTLTNVELAFNNNHFEGFAGYKIVSIAVAVIAPIPVWVGYVTVVGCLLTPFMVYYLLLSQDLKDVFPVQEPWSTALYAIAAVLLLRDRIKSRDLESSVIKLKAQKTAANNLARILLAIRDLTNSPVQSIELTSVLLKSQVITSIEAAEHLERALVHLRESSLVLAAYDQEVDWSGAATSFDALSMLQERLARMRPGRS